MRHFLVIFGIIVASVMLVAGRRGDHSRNRPIELFPDMDHQIKLRPQAASGFTADGRSSRLPVEGTIARGAKYQEIPEYTGRGPGGSGFVDAIPVKVTEEVFKRGRQRYDIYCLPCHGVSGDGKGITAKLGMGVVGNLHDPRIVGLQDGELFNVVTHGRNLMGGYGSVTTPEDRWAIIAYVRALQFARLGQMDEVPEEARKQFNLK